MENNKIQEIYNRLTTDQAFAEECNKTGNVVVAMNLLFGTEVNVTDSNLNSNINVTGVSKAYNELFDAYNNSRPCIGIAIIDNYEDIKETEYTFDYNEKPLSNLDELLFSFIFLATSSIGAVPIPPETNATLPRFSYTLNPFPNGPITGTVSPATNFENCSVPVFSPVTR